MKKYILILTILSTIYLVGCGHEHTFSDATCESPKTCTECGEIEGTALEHQWLEATTENPKTCSLCGLTEGEPLEAPEESEETPTEAAPDSGVDSAGTSVTLEPDEYKGDNNYETNTPEEQDETTKAMKELFKEDLENGLMSQEEYDFLIKSLDDAAAYESQTPAPSPSVNVTKIGPGAEVTTGYDNGIEYGEVQVGSGDYSDLSGYRID